MYYTLLTSLSEEAFLDFYKRFVPAVLAFLFQLSDNLKKKKREFSGSRNKLRTQHWLNSEVQKILIMHYETVKLMD